MKFLIAYNIKWDFSDTEYEYEPPSLPTSVIIPEDKYDKDKFDSEDAELVEEAIEEVSDWLTDTYGFCHKGLDLDYFQSQSPTG